MFLNMVVYFRTLWYIYDTISTLISRDFSPIKVSSCARQMYIPEASLLTLRKKSFCSLLLGSPKNRPSLIQIAVGEKWAVKAVHQQEKLLFSFNVTICWHVVCAYGTSEKKIRNRNVCYKVYLVDCVSHIYLKKIPFVTKYVNLHWRRTSAKKDHTVICFKFLRLYTFNECLKQEQRSFIKFKNSNE